MKRQKNRWKLYYKGNFIEEHFCCIRAVGYYLEKIASKLGVKKEEIYCECLSE